MTAVPTCSISPGEARKGEPANGRDMSEKWKPTPHVRSSRFPFAEHVAGTYIGQRAERMEWRSEGGQTTCMPPIDGRALVENSSRMHGSFRRETPWIHLQARGGKVTAKTMSASRKTNLCAKPHPFTHPRAFSPLLPGCIASFYKTRTPRGRTKKTYMGMFSWGTGAGRAASSSRIQTILGRGNEHCCQR